MKRPRDSRPIVRITADKACKLIRLETSWVTLEISREAVIFAIQTLISVAIMFDTYIWY